MRSYRILPAVLLLCLTTSCHASSKSSGWSRFRTFVPRGGSGAVSSPQPYSVVSVVAWRGTPENPAVTVNPCPPPPAIDIKTGCMLVADTDRFTPLWTARGVNWKDRELNLPKIWNTVALLSDVLIVVVEAPSSDDMYPVIPNELVRSLVDGMQNRVASNLPKGRLILLLNHPAEQEELTSWRESLSVSEGVSQLGDDLLDCFFICSASSFEEALQDIWEKHQSGISTILEDPADFPRLLEQVFQSKVQDALPIVQQSTDEALVPRDIYQNQAETENEEGTPSEEDVIQLDDTNMMNDATLSSDETGTESADRPFNEDEDRILQTALQGLDEVEVALQSAWLDPAAPPQDFSKLCNPVLEDFEKAVQPYSPLVRIELELQVGARVNELYLQHLETLRNSFGSMYETLLDSNTENPEAWEGAAKKVSEGFRKAALHAIPKLARKGGVFYEMAGLEYTGVFAGLLQDMSDVTELRTEVGFDNIADDSVAEKPQNDKRVIKWLKVLGARAVVFGVNYIQGWLAWQAIRRSALERERNMPKFPLF